ncbi:hypothetical protein NPIL_639931, partial [Nephila pilipes]
MTTDVRGNSGDQGEVEEATRAVEMTVVSVKQAKEDSPTLDEMERCRKLEIAIRELAATNETIFTFEAKINNIQLFPHLYSPEAKEEAINALERWKHERSRNQ